MSDTRGDLQFWQTVAGVVGTGLAALIVGLGRRAGSIARRSPDATPAGDALQREILDQLKRGGEATAALTEEIRGLRTDWQAKRDADEQRRREQRDRSVDDRLDELFAGQKTSRINQNEMKLLMSELVHRLPAPPATSRSDPRLDRDPGTE